MAQFSLQNIIKKQQQEEQEKLGFHEWLGSMFYSDSSDTSYYIDKNEITQNEYLLYIYSLTGESLESDTNGGDSSQ